MDQKVSEISEKLFHKKYEQLNEREKKVADRLAKGTPISREKQWAELISIQQEQLRLLNQFSEEPKKDQ
jgi:FixJ family two-component response regulator